jgi:hypothetical protein
MRAAYNFLLNRLIRLGVVPSLIFFACYFILGCKANKKELAILWENDKAIGISIPKSLISNKLPANSLQVRLKDKPASLLGQYIDGEDELIFKSAIPMVAGRQYQLYHNDRFIGSVQVAASTLEAIAPQIIAIYPSADTLPENLLKIYIHFSVPMQEGESLEHLHLLDDKNDTMKGVFLELQPELWNKESTVLTLWLDPGRIKRELIPNQRMGAPLQRGKKYSIAVSGQWKSAQGIAMNGLHTKSFITTSRDSVPPKPYLWNVQPPQEGTAEPLTVILNDALDFFLLQETVSILNSREEKVKGTIKTSADENSFQFIPQQKWQRGKHTIRVASYLEDLAGNSIERPFDRDIRLPKTATVRSFIDREFEIRN